MRVRVRGPSGQSVLNFEDSTTVDSFRKTIGTETGLSSFDIKYGYPPKSLPLEQYSGSTPLRDLDVKLSGEQLIVSRKDAASDRGATLLPPQAKPEAINKASSSSAAQTKRKSTESPVKMEKPNATAGDTGFSFGSLGATPPPKSSSTTKAATKPISSTAPLALSRKSNADVMSDPPEIVLPEQGGTLVLRIMPDDNSCLFRAISYAVLADMDAMRELRSVIAQTIQANPDTYPKVVLDNKDPDDYCRWIQTEDAWGGQIELNILSTQFDVEICSIDVQRLRVDRYNEGRPTRCIVVYSGIHYDTIVLSPFDMPPEYDKKIFDSTDDTILASAVTLCQKLQDKHYYTDTAGFNIKCNDCGTTVTGEAGATEHASKTGHYNFGEAG